MKHHHLASCPSSPNCVCTLGNSQNHFMPPYRYRNTLEEAKTGLKQVFSEMSRTELIQEEDIYLHYEVTSLLARFVDDVEILFDDATKSIHFRSAARTGYYDFGVNRRRMEEIRSRLDDQG